MPNMTKICWVYFPGKHPSQVYLASFLQAHYPNTWQKALEIVSLTYKVSSSVKGRMSAANLKLLRTSQHENLSKKNLQTKLNMSGFNMMIKWQGERIEWQSFFENIMAKYQLQLNTPFTTSHKKSYSSKHICRDLKWQDKSTLS